MGSKPRKLYLYPSPELCYNPNIENTIPLSESSASPKTGHTTGSPAPRFPAPAYEQQDKIFGGAFGVLQQAIGQTVFPAVSLAVTHNGKLVALKAFGRFTYEPGSPVSTATIFDLASVTKVVATTSMAMILYERGLLDLEMPVVGIVPEFAGSDTGRREVTLRMLLAHSSGPACIREALSEGEDPGRTAGGGVCHPTHRRSRHQG